MDETLYYAHETRKRPPSPREEYCRRASKEASAEAKMYAKRKVVIRVVIVAAILVIVAIGLGYWTCQLKKSGRQAEETKNAREISHGKIADMIDRNEIENQLRYLTKLPHSAGTVRNYELAKYIKDTWENEYGIKSELLRYNVLLSHPSTTNKSAVYLVSSEGKVMFKTQSTEPAVERSEKAGNVVPSFAAYSPSGSVQADVVYVNYGRIEDFEYLAQQNVSCKGKIVIARYGKNFRGDKVNFAHQHGAIGIIVYSDPGKSAPDSKVGNYPNSKYMPCSGVQRGSFRAGIGDPETPGYPSKDGIYRIPKERQKFQKIPIYPISACDAKVILSKLSNNISVPESWQGGLDINYSIGPGFQRPYSTWKVRLEVHNEERRENIYNVIGILYGKEEPDRRVIIGNHRDAWVFGGVDPSGGTACLMEIARALGRARRKGWQPRRTIMLSSWGGEEYGMIGSTEYTEEFSKTLSAEAIAYLNIDSPVRGNYSLFARSSPVLFDVLYNAAKKVKNPTNKQETVYEQWLRNLPMTENQTVLPRIDHIASGSDYMAFSQQLGISSFEIRYISSNTTLGYPVYHSLHDTFNYVKLFVDPNFLQHRAVAQVMLQSALDLANTDVLPMNVTKYADVLTHGVQNLHNNFAKTFRKHNISLDYVQKAVDSLKRASDDLRKEKTKINKKEILKLRMFNDKLTFLERGFIRNTFSTGQLNLRHIIFGLDANNSYKTVIFPGLHNILIRKPEDKETIEDQINILITQIQSVAYYLRTDDENNQLN